MVSFTQTDGEMIRMRHGQGGRDTNNHTLRVLNSPNY